MTRLQLVKALSQFLGTEDPTNVTTTVGTLPTYQSDLVVAIDTAYEEIQTLHSAWNWRRKQGTLTTVASTRTYAYSDISANCVALIPFVSGFEAKQVLLISNHEVIFVPYRAFRGYLDKGTRTSAKPVYYTIQPDETIEFDPTPDAIYTVTLDYLNAPEVFTADADIPDMPTRFHRVIVYRAAMQMSEFDENTLRFGMAKARYSNLLNELMENQLPQQDINIISIGQRNLY